MSNESNFNQNPNPEGLGSHDPNGDGSWLLHGNKPQGDPSSAPIDPVHAWKLEQESAPAKDSEAWLAEMGVQNTGSTIDESDDAATATLAASYCEPESPATIASRLLVPAVFVAAISVAGMVLWKTVRGFGSDGDPTQSAGIEQTDGANRSGIALKSPNLPATDARANSLPVRGRIQRDGSVTAPEIAQGGDSNRPSATGFTPSQGHGHSHDHEGGGDGAHAGSHGDGELGMENLGLLTPMEEGVAGLNSEGQELESDFNASSDSMEDGMDAIAEMHADSTEYTAGAWSSLAPFQPYPFVKLPLWGPEGPDVHADANGSDWIDLSLPSAGEEMADAEGAPAESSEERIAALENLDDMGEMPFVWDDETAVVATPEDSISESLVDALNGEATDGEVTDGEVNEAEVTTDGTELANAADLAIEDPTAEIEAMLAELDAAIALAEEESEMSEPGMAEIAGDPILMEDFEMDSESELGAVTLPEDGFGIEVPAEDNVEDDTEGDVADDVADAAGASETEPAIADESWDLESEWAFVEEQMQEDELEEELWAPESGGTLRMDPSMADPFALADQQADPETEGGLADAEIPMEVFLGVDAADETEAQDGDIPVTDAVEMIIVDAFPPSEGMNENGNWILGEGATEPSTEDPIEGLEGDSAEENLLEEELAQVDAPIFEVLPLIESGQDSDMDLGMGDGETGTDSDWHVAGPHSIDPWATSEGTPLWLPEVYISEEAEQEADDMGDALSLQAPGVVLPLPEMDPDFEGDLVATEDEAGELLSEIPADPSAFDPELIAEIEQDLANGIEGETMQDPMEEGVLSLETGETSMATTSSEVMEGEEAVSEDLGSQIDAEMADAAETTVESPAEEISEVMETEVASADGDQPTDIFGAYSKWTNLGDKGQLDSVDPSDWAVPTTGQDGGSANGQGDGLGGEVEAPVQRGVLRRRVLDKGHWPGVDVPIHAMDEADLLLTPNVGPVRVIALEGETIEGRLHGVGQGYVWLENKLGRMSIPSRRIERVVRIDPRQYRSDKKSALDYTKLPKVRVKVKGGVFIGYELARDGNRVTIRTEKGHKMTLVSDEITSANSFRAVNIRRKGE